MARGAEESAGELLRAVQIRQPDCALQHHADARLQRDAVDEVGEEVGQHDAAAALTPALSQGERE